MLLDPKTLDLIPSAADLLADLDGDRRFKQELPASQLEILTEPTESAAEAIGALATGRGDLVAAAADRARIVAAGVHPFAAAEGELSSSERYESTHAEYGPVARRQLVASLQVHVAVGGAERTLRVYNALRGYLPEIAALAANAAIYEGGDTGFASVRPKIAEALPRQGVPPIIESWEAYAAELRWGATSGGVTEPRLWWWELRPHPAFGTLEIRVPDAQSILADAAAIAAFSHALVALLAERHDADEELEEVPSWRIEENRWSAARHGVEGEMADLRTGERQPTRDRLEDLVAELEPISRRLGSAEMLGQARELIQRNGAIRQRELVRSGGPRALTAWLAEHFLDPVTFAPGSESAGAG